MDYEMRHAFAKALKTARKAQGLTQEDFSNISSRSYISTLERGKKSPTLEKVDDISQTIGINILSLLTLTHLYFEKEEDLDSILDKIRLEVNRIYENEPSA